MFDFCANVNGICHTEQSFTRILTPNRFIQITLTLLPSLFTNHNHNAHIWYSLIDIFSPSIFHKQFCTFYCLLLISSETAYFWWNKNSTNKYTHRSNTSQIKTTQKGKKKFDKENHNWHDRKNRRRFDSFSCICEIAADIVLKFKFVWLKRSVLNDTWNEWKL